MLEANANALTVAEQDVEGDQTRTRDVQTHSVTQPYADAEPFELGSYDYPAPGFVRELLDELDKDVSVPDAKLIDTVDPSKDIDDGLLVAYPDQSLMFLGKDPTAKDAMPWYAFTIEAHEPVPAPETARDALDLLKPPEVKDTIAEEDWIPNRHGEWWLLPTTRVPLGESFKPGVKSEPYGPSPLGNHVPREYAFTVTDSAFMDRFTDSVDNVPSSVQSVPEALEWSYRQIQKDPTPDWAPHWPEIREWAGDVLVRGTSRHRDDDHFVENCGETWHRAVTHRIEVYTADALGEGVHLDYYGT